MNRMRSPWNSKKAAAFRGDLRRRIHSSRLNEREPLLVLHGDGSTRVEVRQRSIFGTNERMI
jgi:rhamnose utilization protein RhaD (predicted bifunctional aldolase and dehydrogenase)